MTDSSPPGADVALAEFNALRAEILAHWTARGALMALAITAIGVVGGFVIEKGASSQLLLILPFLMCAIGMKSSEHTRRIFLLHTYIREELWPYLTPEVPGPRSGRASRSFPSWEATIDAGNDPPGRWWSADRLTYLLLHGLPGGLVFGLGSVVPLVLLVFIDEALADGVYKAVWVLATVLTLLYAWLALMSERSPQRAAGAADDPR